MASRTRRFEDPSGDRAHSAAKGRLDLERHKTPAGVCARIARRVLALIAAIWLNDRLGRTVRR